MKKNFSRAARGPFRDVRLSRDQHHDQPRQHRDRADEAAHNDFVFGLHAVTALLKHHPQSVVELFIQEGRHDPRMEAILERAQKLHLPCTELGRAELDERVHGVHQGVIARVSQLKLERSEAQLDELLAALDHPPFLLVLDGVTDPHNLGACLRSAEATGVDAVIVPKDKSALITPTARKVACGAAELVPFVAVTNLARSLKSLQERGVWILGAAGEATQSLYQSDLRGPLALVMGSEGSGMRRLTREHCDALFSIPMAGEVSSLNVSVSAGICLFEAVRQRRVQ
jgi:23S rRNA (guanosine2251-2'-O)-methyltransferase